MADVLLDTTGLNCPLPILKTKKAMAGVAPGGTIEVLATDGAADNDFRAFCRSTGHELLEATRDGDVYRFLIRRKP